MVSFELAKALKENGFPQPDRARRGDYTYGVIGRVNNKFSGEFIQPEIEVFIPLPADILKGINNPLVLVAFEQGHFVIYLHPDSDILDVLAMDKDMAEALGKAYLKLKGVEYSNTDRPKI